MLFRYLMFAILPGDAKIPGAVVIRETSQASNVTISNVSKIHCGPDKEQKIIPTYGATDLSCRNLSIQPAFLVAPMLQLGACP